MFSEESDFQSNKRQLKKILLARQKTHIINRYIKKNFSEPPYNLDQTAFKKMVMQIESRIAFSDESPALELPDPEMIYDSVDVVPVVRLTPWPSA